MNKIKSIISILLLLLIIIGGVIWYVYQPITKIDTFALSNVYSQEAKTRFAPNGKIYTGICKFDLLKPEIFSIFNEEDKKQTVIYSTIQRSNYFDQNWKYDYIPNALGGTNFYEKTFEEVKQIFQTKTCEQIRNNKDDVKITNYPPLTPEEIESNKKLREETNSLEKQWGFLQKIYNGIESQYPAPLDNEKKLKKRTELLPFLALSKEIQTTLNENKTYTATDGTIVQPTQENKKIIAENTQLVEWLLKQTE
jgi:hypothetical protein